MKDLIKGQRKLAALIVVMVVGVAVDSINKNGLSTNLLDLLKYLGLGFFGGNAVEHLSTLGKSNKDGRSAPIIQANNDVVTVDSMAVPEVSNNEEPPAVTEESAVINVGSEVDTKVVPRIDAIGQLSAVMNQTTNNTFEIVKINNQALSKLLDWVNSLPKRPI